MSINIEAFKMLPRDKQILAWDTAKKELDAVKEREMEMRKLIIDSTVTEFDPVRIGTQNVELGNGWKLKAVIKNNYTLDSDNDKVEKYLDSLEDWQADRLVKWSPRFMKSEYDQLDKASQASMQDILTIKLASPTLSLIPPKG